MCSAGVICMVLLIYYVHGISRMIYSIFYRRIQIQVAMQPHNSYYTSNHFQKSQVSSHNPHSQPFNKRYSVLGTSGISNDAHTLNNWFHADKENKFTSTTAYGFQKTSNNHRHSGLSGNEEQRNRVGFSKSPTKNFYLSAVSKQNDYTTEPLEALKIIPRPPKNKNQKENISIPTKQPLKQRLKYFQYKNKQENKSSASSLHLTASKRPKIYSGSKILKQNKSIDKLEKNSPCDSIQTNLLQKKEKSNLKNLKEQIKGKKSSFFERQKFDEEEDECRKTPSFEYSFLMSKQQEKKEDNFNENPKLSDFILGECKGEGRFGKVYLAVHKKSGFLFALKKIKKDSVKYMLDQFIQELKIQQYLSHPNLVKIYGYFADHQHFYMMIEYMEEGSLYSLMKKKGKCLQEGETSKKMYEICSGIQFMHNQNIVHRDLKPENIVMTHGVSKICDFGWAAICVDRRNTYCGTLDYVCPEIADGKQYDSSVDIWCLGIMAYQMMCGKAPFYDISRKKTIQNIKMCQISTFPTHLSGKAIKFISMILQKNPQQRVGIKQLLSSQFLKGIQMI